MKRGLLIGIFIAIIIIVIAATVYFVWGFFTTCSSQECFDKALVKCSRTTFISDNENMLMQYKIKGTSEGNCLVNVKLLQVKKGSSELATLENQDMDCSLPFGIVVVPEGDTTICHGRLKEEIQSIIIKRMHAQIIQNIGKISAETTNIL